MKTNEYQLISQVKSPFSASHSRPVLPVHSQSNSQILNFKNDDIDLIDTKRKLSDTPTPSEYNSFTWRPPRPLSIRVKSKYLFTKLRQAIEYVTFKLSISNKQHHSYFVGSGGLCEMFYAFLIKRQFNIDRSKKKRGSVTKQINNSWCINLTKSS